MPGPYTYFDPEEALDLLRPHLIRLEAEEVPLAEANGRVLATALEARLDQPRFRKAAVDGFALLPGQGTEPFISTATVAAGDPRKPEEPSNLKEGEALRIMTGAVVPPDVERVVRIEYTEKLETGAYRVVTQERQTNIAEPGENIRAGDPLLSQRFLTPLDVGILASQGYAQVSVVRRPRVIVISTGTELYYPDAPELPPWGIYDSNSYQLTALSETHLARVENRGILGDDQERITEALRSALDEADVLICSGGVSMGDLDFVPAALQEIGATVHFHGLAVKPGKPTLFATHQGRLVFGLPGNPVSTAAQFEFFIAPALRALQGLHYTPREALLPLAEPFRRTNADRHEYLPGNYRDGQIRRINYRGSGHLSALADADLLFRIDRGVSELARGEQVYARFIRPNNRLSSDLGNR
ncbi:MAG: molybdopterin molybdotransferase MoeA [Spirochaetaceae bacterium]